MVANSSLKTFSGCYKGQETISRLVTYDGVKQKLWGIHLSSPAEPGSPITVDGKKVPMFHSLILIPYSNLFWLRSLFALLQSKKEWHKILTIGTGEG